MAAATPRHQRVAVGLQFRVLVRLALPHTAAATIAAAAGLAVERDSTPSTVSRVARRMGLSRQGVQRVADRLVTDGFLEVHPNPDHRRSPLLHLTPHGDHVLTEARLRQERWADHVGAALDARDLASACRVLGALSHRLQGE